MPLNGNGWNPTSITRAISKYETATRTVRVETDAGEGFLKALGNPEGPQVLACELVGSCAANWLGLKTFDFSLIEVTNPDEVVISGQSYAAPGPAFITRAEESGFTWGGDQQTLAAIANQQDVSRLVVLDTWLRNCDRHSPDGQRINLGNVFLLQRTQPQRGLELIAMDFTHSFTCGQALDRRLGHIEKIRDNQTYGLFPEFRTLLARETVVLSAARLSTFTLADANAMTSIVPVQWMVSDAVMGAWNKFITDRAHFLADNIERMLWPENVELEFSGVPNEL
jgi:hypothetical protein